MKCVNAIAIALVLGLGTFTRAIEIDQSTPSAAALSFAKALEAGDQKSARELAIGTEPELQVIDAMVDLTASAKKLHDVAVAKYAEKADEATGSGLSVDSSKALEGTEIKEQGDTATLTYTKSQGTQAPMQLKKIDGKWKVNLSETFQAGAALGQNSAQMQSMLKGWSEAVAEVAGEIDKGQYPLAADAKQALDMRIMMKLKATPTTAPATQPATQPAK